ncbi:MAG: methylated-DNA--[protein]-cysteine S-methyltransferase [Rhodobacteraceae bacterium]|jgi:methylated-DNA-[protein]-cysteine S-methyltransferase|nr:methylated-DNA--[protein]-cysteine S-methyltransferase [Paracoccaceae bacterium]
MPSLTLPSPFGPLTITEANGTLTALDWRAGHTDPSDLLHHTATQLTAYFAGVPYSFDLPFEWGTGLNAQVRRAMAAIPHGQTRTYGAIAKALNTNAQAVGQACGANPLPILIPCHRVMGTHWFGGFSAPGGVETKAALLRLEGALLI